jgi:hypothetical protein
MIFYYLKSGGAFNNDIVLSECRDIASDIWLIEPATAEIKSHKSLQKSNIINVLIKELML